MLHGGEVYIKTNIRYDFSVNINPLGVPVQVRSRLSEAIAGVGETGSCLELYPDRDCTQLRRALAECTGLPEDEILCGNGASELIEAAVRAIRPGRILLTAPSFSGYRHAAENAGAQILYHALRREEDFCLTERYLEDLELLLGGGVEPRDRYSGNQGSDPVTAIQYNSSQQESGWREDWNSSDPAMAIQCNSSQQESGWRDNWNRADPVMAILCNPANPVGNTIEAVLFDRIVEKCARLGIWLLVDECFLGFLTDGEERTAQRYLHAGAAGIPGGGADRLLVLDAFTKRFAMPGVRLGYLMARNTAILAKIHAQQPEWSVSVPAQVAGLAALETEVIETAVEPGDAYLERTRALVVSERRRMADALRRMGFRVFPGEANFIFFSISKEEVDRSGHTVASAEPEPPAARLSENAGRNGSRRLFAGNMQTEEAEGTVSHRDVCRLCKGDMQTEGDEGTASHWDACRSREADFPNLQEALLQKGFLIRSCENYAGLHRGDYRIAVLSPEKNTALLEAMEEVVR